MRYKFYNFVQTKEEEPWGRTKHMSLWTKRHARIVVQRSVQMILPVRFYQCYFVTIREQFVCIPVWTVGS